MQIILTIEFEGEPGDSQIGGAFMKAAEAMARDLEIKGTLEVDDCRVLEDAQDWYTADYYRVD